MAGFAPVAGARESRVLRYAVLLSIGLHLALLFGISSIEQRVERVPAPPIHSRLVEEQAAPKAEEPPQPAPQTAKPAPPRPARVAKAAPRALPQAADPVPASPGAQAAPAPPALPVLPAAPAAPVPPVASVRPALQREEASDARSLSEYRLQVIFAARRDKELNKERYGRIARATDWTGRVVVVVAIESDGKVQLRTRTSSGHRSLDQQAVEMFGRAVRSVRIPEALRGKAFDFEVTALFELED